MSNQSIFVAFLENMNFDKWEAWQIKTAIQITNKVYFSDPKLEWYFLRILFVGT